MKTQHDYWQESHDQVMQEMSMVSNGMPIPGMDRQQARWEKHFIIWPKIINGRWYCRDWVWRRWVIGPGGGFWQYGDAFDRLRDL
jgi:hypothetical protein